MMTATPKPVANGETIYFTDNGATYCGRHLGSTARFTGRDLSGQPIEAVTPEVVKQAQTLYGYTPACETCGKEASALHRV